MSFGTRLKAARKTKKLTQSEVASKLGIDDTTISKYENDKSEPDNETLRKLSELYGCTIGYLLGDQEEKKHPALIFREYIEEGLSNEEIKKRMDFFLDFMKLSDENIDEFISFVKWKLDSKKEQAAAAGASSRKNQEQKRE